MTVVSEIAFTFFGVVLLLFVFLSAYQGIGRAFRMSDKFLKMHTVSFIFFMIFSAFYAWAIVFYQFGHIPIINHLYMTKILTTLLFMFGSVSFYYLVKIREEYSHIINTRLRKYFNILEALTLCYILVVAGSFIWIGSEWQIKFLAALPFANLLFIFMYYVVGRELEKTFHEPLLKGYVEFNTRFMVITISIFSLETLIFLIPALREYIDILRVIALVLFCLVLMFGRFTTVKVMQKIEESFVFK